MSFTSGVNVLATKLVEQWLKIVKDETVPEREVMPQPVIVNQESMETLDTISASDVDSTLVIKQEDVITKKEDSEENKTENKSLEISAQTFYKVTVRDGKQVIHKVENEETVMDAVMKEEVVETDGTTVSQPNPPTVTSETKDTKEKVTEVKEKKEEEKKSSKERSSSKHHDKKHKSSSSSSSSKSSSHKDSNKDKSSSRDKHKSRDKKHSSRDKEHRSNGQHKSSSSSGNSKENKDKQTEKEKTLAKVLPHSIDKLGKIPKKSSSSNDSKDKSKSEKKDEHNTSHKHKSSISIEVRKKGDGERPKTVKVFNSKLRSTGLEEAPKPPPSRLAVKKPSATLPAVIPLKRPSPSREAPPPPEKKIKLPEPEEKQEKPGGIKLIPPKPKRKYNFSITFLFI